MEVELEKRRVRVICGVKDGKLPNREFPYIIPITRDKSGYITGQNLPDSKKINQELLTAEDRKTYPFVIDPEDALRVRHHEWLNLSNVVDKARYDLLMLSKKWARSKKEFEDNKSIFDGYLEDRALESKTKNTKRDLQFEAESLFRQSTMGEHNRIALMLNTLIPHFNVDPKVMTEEEVKEQILEACVEYPDKVKLCFKEHNVSVEFEYFILELVQYGIIRKTAEGDYFDGTTPLGRNYRELNIWLEKKENSYRRNKWASILQEKKGNLGTELPSKEQQEEELVKACEVSLYKKDVEDAEKAIDTLSRYFQNNDRLNEFRTNLDLIKVPVQKEKPKEDMVSPEVAKFSLELAKSNLQQLQGRVKHHLSPYKEEDCTDIWGNKDALINYMVRVKFNK